MQIGIDLGATKIEYILLDNQNKELIRNRISTPKDYIGTIKSIISIIKITLCSLNLRKPIISDLRL